MRKFIIFSLFAAAASMTVPSTAIASPCKDAKGKFIKCAPKPMAKKGPCKDAKGKFIKCHK